MIHKPLYACSACVAGIVISIAFAGELTRAGITRTWKSDNPPDSPWYFDSDLMYWSGWDPAGDPDWDDNLSINSGSSLLNAPSYIWWQSTYKGEIVISNPGTTVSHPGPINQDWPDELWGNEGLTIVGSLKVVNGAHMIWNPFLPSSSVPGGHRVFVEGYIFAGFGESSAVDGRNTIEVSGNGSLLKGTLLNIVVGEWVSQGTLRVLNGGAIEGWGLLTKAPDSRPPSGAEINVTGADSRVHVRTTAIGAPGMTTISAGGSLETTDLIVDGGKYWDGDSWIPGPHSLVIDDGVVTAWKSVVLGDNSDVDVTIRNGGELRYAESIILAKGVDSQAHVVVTGPSSSLSVDNYFDRLTIGVNGTATLEVLNGGFVRGGDVGIASQWPDYQPSLLVSGKDSKFVYETLTLDRSLIVVENGGLLKSFTTDFDSVDIVGNDFGSWAEDATVWVIGNGSQWENYNGAVIVGRGRGIGELIVEDGGYAHFAQLKIGQLIPDAANGVGIVGISGPKSEVLVRGHYYGIGPSLVVGDGHHGYVNITKGGKLSGPETYLAPVSGSKAVVNVVNPGSRMELSALYIGGTETASGGEASLTLSDKATVKVYEEMKVWGHGTLTLQGGSVLTILGTKLTTANAAKCIAEPGAKIELLGTSLVIENSDPADLAGFANTTLVFAGGEGVTDTIEIAGLDGGRSWSNFSNNFTIGRLEVGAPTRPGHLRLADDVVNVGGNEALYVRELLVHPGSSLDLGGRRLYALDVRGGEEFVQPSGGELQKAGYIERLWSDAGLGSYVPPGGDAGRGTLYWHQTADLVMESDHQQEVFNNTQVLLSAFLQADYSSEGLAHGVFGQGLLRIRDEAGDTLLETSLDGLHLVERANGALHGSLLVTVIDHSLPDALPPDYAGAMRLIVDIQGASVDHFGQYFSGVMQLELRHVSEPGGALLVALSVALSICRKRDRRSGQRR